MCVIPAVLALTWITVSTFSVLAWSFLALAGLLLVIVKSQVFRSLTWQKILMWIEFLYLIRFQLIAALLLALVLPAAYFLVPSLAIGLFDARGFISFALIVWMAVQLAWTVMITARLVLVYGPERFTGIRDLTPPVDSQPPQEVSGRFQRRAGDLTYWDMTLFGLLAAPCVTLLSFGTRLEWYFKLGGIVFGTGVALVLLFLTALWHYRIERWDAGWTAARVFPSFGVLDWRQGYPRPGYWRVADRVLNALPDRLRAGLVSDGQLRSGHQVAATSLLFELIVYVALGFGLRPDHVLPEHEPAALFFALFLIMLLTWLFTGAAFFLDVIRVPVLSTVLILSMLSGTVARTDHLFAVSHVAQPENNDVSPVNVVRQWETSRQAGANSPAIIVATAGGGIRAAAWTTQVLTSLESESRERGCPVTLGSSLLAISSVSGGSVGSMFFVAAYDSGTGKLPASDRELRSVRFNSARSTLSAVGWGLLYPDSARTLPLIGMLVPQTVDRGWALENAWIAGWKDPPNISNWRHDVATGHRPAAIFNATAAESGERFLIASTDLPGIVLSDPNGTLEDKETIQFSRDFSGYDVPVVTAARLSATFPYVSAEAQASDGPAKARVHVGDGGYYDNSGVLSALEWVEEASPALKGHPVLFLLIDAEPGSPPTGKRWSWQRQLIAPLDTLMNVRSSSQQLRSKIELGIGERQLQFENGLSIGAVPFLYSTNIPAPLSWHLTKEQHDSIRNSWQEKSTQSAEVMKFLGCK